jgi:hypothetical protein
VGAEATTSTSFLGVNEIAKDDHSQLNALTFGLRQNTFLLSYMKFATAVYGESMIRAAEMDVLGKFNTSSLTLLPGDDANNAT